MRFEGKLFDRVQHACYYVLCCVPGFVSINRKDNDLTVGVFLRDQSQVQICNKLRATTKRTSFFRVTFIKAQAKHSSGIDPSGGNYKTVDGEVLEKILDCLSRQTNIHCLFHC